MAFRYYAQETAWRLDLYGWIRNLSSGDVELIAEGDRQSVETFARWCNEGPPLAEVDEVVVEEQPVDEPLKPFAILRTL